MPTLSPFPIEALILAGGASSRMGTPKTSLLWDAMPLWRFIARRTAQFTGRVRIVGFPQGEPLPPTDGEFPFIEDRLNLGPLGGLAIGLDAIQSEFGLVVACDMPFVSEAAVKELLRSPDHVDAIVPRAPDGLHPTFALYSRRCLPAIHAVLEEGKRQVTSFFPQIRLHEFKTSGSALDWDTILFNINTPQDLELAKRARERTLA